MTPGQMAYFLEHLPDVELRNAYPTAALEATIRNMMGGKREKPAEEGGEPPLQEHELYSAAELLPWYARPAWIESAIARIDKATALDFLKHRRELPAWALQLAPLDAIKRAAQ